MCADGTASIFYDASPPMFAVLAISFPFQPLDIEHFLFAVRKEKDTVEGRTFMGVATSRHQEDSGVSPLRENVLKH